jgi:AbrB family looped-hinge helix DNA binding protein
MIERINVPSQMVSHAEHGSQFDSELLFGRTDLAIQRHPTDPRNRQTLVHVSVLRGVAALFLAQNVTEAHLDRRKAEYYFFASVILRGIVVTTVTVKGQVTLPKAVREATGIKPGDKVEVRATASGAVIIEKPGAGDDYKARLYALAREQPIKGITTEDLMEMTRGED